MEKRKQDKDKVKILNMVQNVVPNTIGALLACVMLFNIVLSAASVCIAANAFLILFNWAISGFVSIIDPKKHLDHLLLF